MSDPIPEPDPSLSRDAKHSTYAPAPVDEEQNPPAGPATVQTLGKPTETTPTRSSKTPAKES
jgi:hypothetical protein